MSNSEEKLVITIDKNDDKELWCYLKTISKNNPKEYLRRAVSFMNHVSGTEQTYLGYDSPEALVEGLKATKSDLKQKKEKLIEEIKKLIDDLLKEAPEDLGIMVGPEPELYSVDEDSILGWIVLNHLYIKEIDKLLKEEA